MHYPTTIQNELYPDKALGQKAEIQRAVRAKGRRDIMPTTKRRTAKRPTQIIGRQTKGRQGKKADVTKSSSSILWRGLKVDA